MQTRLISFIEAVLNVGSGLVVSACVWVIVGPYYGYSVLFTTALGLSSIFTVTSTIRSYLWRRFMENWGNVWLHKLLYKKDKDEDADLFL